jgi:cytochrome c peroxidase
LLLISATAVWAIVADLSLVGALHDAEAEHIEQADLMALVTNGESAAAFETAFAIGDELFETRFNALDGVGANVGQGQRFTRVPRADLTGPGEWANHTPARATGPNAEECAACHNTPTDDGAGLAASNVHRDPLHTGNLGAFIQRNTPHTFALGAVQRLAEEMTEQLQHLRDRAAQLACQTQQPVTKSLSAKGVSFGTIVVTPLSGEPCTVNVDTSGVQGVDPDLVIRPFQWKGSVAFIRAFNRDAAHNELGMQAVEIVGGGVDGDFDGVADEMSVGDHTALAIYLAAQPRPTSRVELSELGLIDPLSREEVRAIDRGKRIFSAIGCAACHTPQLRLNDPTFSEPSQNPNYRDALFPAGQDPLASGVDPAHPITFDLTRDQPDNVIVDEHGDGVYRLGALRGDRSGRALVELYGDLKRHDMGPELAEPIDEVGTGASVFLTENLWGVGSTAPYLHDGRATTLTEAILEHGGEAAASRDAFRALSSKDQARLIAFLNNLVLFKLEE